MTHIIPALLCGCVIIGVGFFAIGLVERHASRWPLPVGAACVTMGAAGYVLCYFILHAMIGSVS